MQRADDVGIELGRFLEHRRGELGLSRRELAERSNLSYPYVSQLETGVREPALKAMRALAPVLEVPVDELAALVACGEWRRTDSASHESSPPSPGMSLDATAHASSRDRVLLSVERRLRDVPPLERIALLNELIAQAVEELSGTSQ